MNDVIDEERRFDEGDDDHEQRRWVASELLCVGESLGDAF